MQLGLSNKILSLADLAIPASREGTSCPRESPTRVLRSSLLNLTSPPRTTTEVLQEDIASTSGLPPASKRRSEDNYSHPNKRILINESVPSASKSLQDMEKEIRELRARLEYNQPSLNSSSEEVSTQEEFSSEESEDQIPPGQGEPNQELIRDAHTLNEYTQPSEIVEEPSSPEQSPEECCYYPPARASVIIPSECPSYIRFIWEQKTYGDFTLVNYNPLSFRLVAPNQLLLHKSFLDHCSTSPQDQNKAQRDYYSYALPMFSSDFKSRTQISAGSTYPKLISEKALPFSEEYLDVLEKIRKEKPSHAILTKKAADSEVNKTEKILQKPGDRRTIPKSQPFTALDFPNDKLVKYLNTPPIYDHQGVSDLTLGSSYFVLPSANNRAKLHESKKQALHHVSQMASLFAAMEGIQVFRERVKSKLSHDDLNYLESIQYLLKHVQQGEGSKLHLQMERSAYLHLLLRHEVCAAQKSESLLSAFIYEGPLADTLLLHSEKTKELVNLPESQRILVSVEDKSKASLKGKKPSSTREARPYVPQINLNKDFQAGVRTTAPPPPAKRKPFQPKYHRKVISPNRRSKGKRPYYVDTARRIKTRPSTYTGKTHRQ